MSSENLSFIEWKHSWSSYGFSWMFFNVLLCSCCSYQEQKVWCFDPKLLVVYIKFLLVMDGMVFSINTHTFSTIHTIPITYNFQSPFNPQIISFTLPWPATPIMGVLLGLLCNYIKFWYSMYLYFDPKIYVFT